MNSSINSPENNDNREYDYTLFPDEERPEYGRIIGMVETHSKVIDLGCGSGVLLEKLKSEKQTKGFGVELAESGVTICRQKGLEVTQGNIDARLPFEDDAFDYAICNVTIQMVRFPEILLNEMKRIARYQIISFPNFGFYKNRMELLFSGRMPRKMLFGYNWFSTGHIHQFSVRDFKEFIKISGGLKIIKADYAETTSVIKNKIIGICPNLFSVVSVFLLEKIND
jgi:methionine biosynthesis protein MetW